MRLCLFFLAWGVLPLPGQVGSAAVYTQFQQSPPEAVLVSMKEEVASLMSPAGLNFEWRSLDGVSGREVFSELAVAKFKGECDSDGVILSHFEPEALAWSHVTDGVILPFTDVDCTRLRSFIQSKLVGMDPKSRDRLFGRALGRILAHELYHIFSRDKGHGARQVDKPFLTVTDLLSDDFALEEKESHLLRLGTPASAKGGDVIAAKGRPSRPKDATIQAGLSVYTHDGCDSCHGSHGQGGRHAPALRTKGQWIDSVVLAAKLERSGLKMSRRAKSMKIQAPSVAEEDLSDLVRFLNGPSQ